MDLLNPKDIGGVAWGVIATLLLMSMASLSIILNRSWAFRQAMRQTRRYAPELARLVKLGKLAEAVEASRAPVFRRSPLAQVLPVGLAEWRAWWDASNQDADAAAVATQRALQYATEDCLGQLRWGLSVLATIGSTAPFVGLFGTTAGIINAFRMMATTGNNTMLVISSGISEALITTAFGLLVAVPAVWFYNAFLGRIESLRVELDRSGYQLVNHLLKAAA